MSEDGKVAVSHQAAGYKSWAVRMALLIALIALASRVDDWVLGALDLHLSPANEPYLHRMIMVAVLLYIALMAMPFVPGVEIGLGLMALFGSQIVPLVYLSTVAALMLAFAAGRLIPSGWIIRAFDALRLRRARDMLSQAQALGPAERLALLRAASTRGWLRALLSYRYVAVAIALNTPGNIVFGGGGGIALVAGFSRLFSAPAFAATVALAVCPVPLAVWLAG